MADVQVTFSDEGLSRFISSIEGQFDRLGDRIERTLENALDLNTRDIVRALGRVEDALDGIDREARDAGESIDDSITRGVRSAERAVERSARRMADDLEDAGDRAGTRAGQGIGGGISGSLSNLSLGKTFALGAGAALVSAAVDIGLEAGRAIARGIGAAIDDAADLGEAASAVGVIFGPAAAEIEAFADTALEAFGITETAALQAATTLGASLQNVGFRGVL